MRNVLFVCTQNAGRSQMAQAFFERYAPPDLRAESAGREPAERIHPPVVEAMKELGIDIADRRPKKFDGRDAAPRRFGNHSGLRRPVPLRSDSG